MNASSRCGCPDHRPRKLRADELTLPSSTVNAARSRPLLVSALRIYSPALGEHGPRWKRSSTLLPTLGALKPGDKPSSWPRSQRGNTLFTAAVWFSAGSTMCLLAWSVLRL
jgi:hypothetical protein